MAFDRAELDEMKERWLQANIDVEKAGDWRPLADFYTEDATYGWNYGPKNDFMAVGRNEIRDIAIGLEMDGLDGWTYPYQSWVIDERTGDMIGLWKQINEATRADGTHYALNGVQGSWFKYAGDFKWGWQRDFFDYGNVTALFAEMLTDGVITPGLQGRIDRVLNADGPLPGWYPIGQTPVPMW
ncbi:nuclear transport factor 2 family protein [Gordonia sp. HY285]|uniref:nuclear transport factor 2 family protein n=1 Tax=Gordonia liuliyuniae TaxID=2911517 RepID=UPI001F1EF5C1|nr:nuclear transport factor 2 family protein [Gordonia liuliyuniae]MCF8610250.1 nuclear transport factor 2 family protein [Gordonia liuliyuniae]